MGAFPSASPEMAPAQSAAPIIGRESNGRADSVIGIAETVAMDRTASGWRFAEIANVADIVRHWGSTVPDKVALTYAGTAMTYAGLDRRSNALANRLLAEGIAHGSHIGFFGKNCTEVYEVWFGASKAGCALAPFNWRCSVEELAAVVSDSRTPIVFTTQEFVGVMTEVQKRSPTQFEIVPFMPLDGNEGGLTYWTEGMSAIDPYLPIHGKATALLSYTSGTTGLPKGVMASHEAINYSFLAGALDPDMAWKDDDKILMSMPNFHLGGSWVSLAALYHGASISILPAFEPRGFLELLKRDRATMAALVPAALQMLMDLEGVTRDDFSSLRSIIYFGSPIGIGNLRRATAMMDCGFRQLYGTTETWFLTILRPEDHRSDDVERLKSCGVPLPLISFRIVDDDGNDLPDGTVGEIWVRTPMALTGYWQREDATREVYRDGWYHTGDLGYRDAEGFIFVVDRSKDMIISGGENIYSTEVEQALAKLEGVHSCAVIGLPDTKWGERVVAAIVRSAGATFDEGAVIAHCHGLIARYKTPKQVLFLDSLPLTPTGKVKKAKLRDMLKDI